MPAPVFPRAERVFFALDDAQEKTFQGGMVSRSEAIHLPDGFDLDGFRGAALNQSRSASGVYTGLAFCLGA